MCHLGENGRGYRRDRSIRKKVLRAVLDQFLTTNALAMQGLIMVLLLLRFGSFFMAKTRRSTPRNYDGTALTSHSLKKLLPTTLSNIGNLVEGQSELMFAIWPQVIGLKLASMTKVISFSGGKLIVSVNNSTLYSLFNKNEKSRLLKKLREQLPDVKIDAIEFRIG